VASQTCAFANASPKPNLGLASKILLPHRYIISVNAKPRLIILSAMA
jgi:hypothetical protein